MEAKNDGVEHEFPLKQGVMFRFHVGFWGCMCCSLFFGEVDKLHSECWILYHIALAKFFCY